MQINVPKIAMNISFHYFFLSQKNCIDNTQKRERNVKFNEFAYPTPFYSNEKNFRKLRNGRM
jgi:hypothetical protein